VLHGVWRIPETKDQVRLSFASTYRAPALNDLIAIPSISNQNSATRPDRTGNPALKPELSRGVDLAYEHYLSRAGVMSVNVFIRSIDDLIRRRTVLTDTATGPRWVSSPVNIGHAVTKGIEADAKFPLQEYFPDGPAIDVRANTVATGLRWMTFRGRITVWILSHHKQQTSGWTTASVAFR
jgi:iron complex outermembrane receptor protein